MVVPAKMRVYLLLAASIIFYMCWNPIYILLLLFCILVTYSFAIFISRAADKKRKRILMAAGLILNFSVLFVFKYFNFFGDTINRFIPGLIPSSNLLLPVGISFYTFQAVGYLIDVYRGDAPEKNIFRYSLFVSFFPQLVAGPIERSSNLLKRIRELDTKGPADIFDFRKGAFIMLYGYFMKMVIADRAAILVNTVYDPERYTECAGFSVLLAAVLFSVQIYCDFAGYTYIAIGAARMLGITICENFNTPYLSTGIRDFWDRWHMSLTGWFRDYLYFPLGGSRKGLFRKYVNIMIVFILSGLWHGASWHFVFWGLLHGVLRVTEEVLTGITGRIREKTRRIFNAPADDISRNIFKCIVNFFVVTVCWMFFRAESIDQAFVLIKNMFAGLRLWQLTDGSLLALGLDAKEMNVLFFAGLIMFVIDMAGRLGRDVSSFFAKRSELAQSFVILLGIVFIVIFGVYGKEYDAAAFIYFQF